MLRRLIDISCIAALFPILLLAGCEDMRIEINCYETIPVSIGPAGAAPATKSEPESDQQTGGLDANVANYMLYIFKSDGSLFNKEFVSGNNPVLKYVYRNVEYHIYAVANLKTTESLYSRLGAVTTESAFLATSYKFSDAWHDGMGWLAKTGRVVRTFTSESGTVALKLDRVVAMVRLAQLDFEAEYEDDLYDYYTFDGVYLINTVNEMTFGGSALHYTNCSVAPDSDFACSSDWTGPEIEFGSGEQRDSYSCDYYLWDDALGNFCSGVGGGRYRCNRVFTLYCLANPMTTTTYGCLDPFSDTPRQTRLVVSICDNNGPSYACCPMTIKGSDGWLKPNICYSAGMSIDLDRIGGAESRTCNDGMDWDTGSAGFWMYVSPWQNGGTYTETL